MAKVPAIVMLKAISIIRFITLPFCSKCMDDDHPGHDIHVFVRGNNFPVCLSGFPVSGTLFRIRTWFISFRITFIVSINWIVSDRKLSEQLHRAVEFLSVQTVMGIVSVSVRSNESLKMENFQVLGYGRLRNA